MLKFWNYEHAIRVQPASDFNPLAGQKQVLQPSSDLKPVPGVQSPESNNL